MISIGGCLKLQNDNDDKYPYIPSSTYEKNTLKSTNKSITNIVAEPNNIISEKITLKKNFPSIASTDRHFMGKCKPGKINYILLHFAINVINVLI